MVTYSKKLMESSDKGNFFIRAMNEGIEFPLGTPVKEMTGFSMAIKNFFDTNPSMRNYIEEED